MFEGIMRKFGYEKVNIMDGESFIIVDNEELPIILEVSFARNEEKDVFIDYVKKTGTQKVYVKKGKKKVMVCES